MKRWMKIAWVAAGLLIAASVAIPFLVHANAFRPFLERQLTSVLSRQVKLGDLRLSLFSGSLIAEDLAITDDPNFSTAPFLTAKQLRIGVEMIPLIFSRQLKVRSFAAVSPQIHLVRGPDGIWNFSGVGRKPSGRMENTQQNSVLPDLTAVLITVEDCRAVVESLSAPRTPRVFEHLSLSIEQFSFVRPFSFTLSADLPGDAKLTAAGTAGPINQVDAAMTSFDARMSTKHLDPVAAGLLDRNAGVSMMADIDAHATSDGRTLTSNGRIHMEHLQLRKGGSPTPNAVDLSYTVAQGVRDTSGQVQDARVNTGNVGIHLSGTYQLLTENPLLNLKMTGQKLPIDELQALMTAAGVKLPNGAALKGGTLDVALAVSGVANDLVITGPVELNNTRVVGFELGSKLHGVANLSGIKTGDETNIEKVRLNLRITNAGTQIDKFYALIPALGEISGTAAVPARGSPTPNAVDLNYTVAQGLRNTSGQVQDTSVNTGNVGIHLSGTYQLLTENPLLNLKIAGQKLPIDELQALMTAAGVKLPNGAALKGGTLDVALAVSGVANDLLITGPVEVNNTQLVGFDLGSRIRGIASLSGVKTGDTTSIEKLQMELRVTNADTQVDDINALIPALGEITGSGTVSPASALNFGLTVKVTKAQGIGKVGVDLLTKLNESVHPDSNAAGIKGVPMRVTGTANEPVITADVRGLLHRGKTTLLEGLGKKK